MSDSTTVPSSTPAVVPAQSPIVIDPQGAAGGCGCKGGAGAPTEPPSYVYAIGQVEAKPRNLGMEKEFAQATGRSDTAGFTDRQALRNVLSERSNRYLVRQFCWVFQVERLDTYLLMPRDPVDYDLLVEALRPQPRGTDIDVVIGVRAGLSSPEHCNGLILPVVVFDQVYSFDIDSMVKAIPRPERMTAKEFGPAAEELFTRILQMADNTGSTDEHRAMNYLAVRYPAIYALASAQFAAGASLTAVTAGPSRLSSSRHIVTVVFSFTNRATDVTEKHFVRVDVTEEFPFLVSKLAPFFDR
jgi:hypothetical protein